MAFSDPRVRARPAVVLRFRRGRDETYRGFFDRLRGLQNPVAGLAADARTDGGGIPQLRHRGQAPVVLAAHGARCGAVPARSRPAALPRRVPAPLRDLQAPLRIEHPVCLSGGLFARLRSGGVPAGLERRPWGEPVSLWTIGNSEGVVARTVAHFGHGRVHTVNNNETVENEVDFHRVRPPTAHFLGRPFCDVTPAWLAGLGAGVPDRFTVIHENLSFQMIQDNRREQIAYVAQLLEQDGLFTAIEKCSIPDDAAEYEHREVIKNGFKARYFSEAEIEYKGKDLLAFMEMGQVSLPHLIDETAHLFPHVAIIWNSCNFYTIVASRSAQHVKRFCSFFFPPFIPGEFVFLPIAAPIRARGLEDVDLAFRSPDARLLTKASPMISGSWKMDI